MGKVDEFETLKMNDDDDDYDDDEKHTKVQLFSCWKIKGENIVFEFKFDWEEAIISN